MSHELARSKGPIPLKGALYVVRGRPRTNFTFGVLFFLLALLLLAFIAGEPNLRTWQLILLDLAFFGGAWASFAASKQAASPTDYRIAAFKNGAYIRPDPLFDEQLFIPWDVIEKIEQRRISIAASPGGYGIAFITKGADQRSKHEAPPAVWVEYAPPIVRKLESLRKKYAN